MAMFSLRAMRICCAASAEGRRPNRARGGRGRQPFWPRRVRTYRHPEHGRGLGVSPGMRAASVSRPNTRGH
eukprot:8306000-Lingulodinium_polyedra.AAC.1